MEHFSFFVINLNAFVMSTHILYEYPHRFYILLQLSWRPHKNTAKKLSSVASQLFFVRVSHPDSRICHVVSIPVSAYVMERNLSCGISGRFHGHWGKVLWGQVKGSFPFNTFFRTRLGLVSYCFVAGLLCWLRGESRTMDPDSETARCINWNKIESSRHH